MIILGIDPGSINCGYGLLEVENRRIVAAGSDVIKLDSKLELSERLLQIRNAIRDVILKYKPDVASVESIFYGKNIKSAFTLGHARGVILLALAEQNIPIYTYSPREVKKSVVGNGNASKEQVQYMVTRFLNLKNQPKSEDAADALANAICHFNRVRFL